MMSSPWDPVLQKVSWCREGGEPHTLLITRKLLIRDSTKPSKSPESTLLGTIQAQLGHNRLSEPLLAVDHPRSISPKLAVIALGLRKPESQLVEKLDNLKGAWLSRAVHTANSMKLSLLSDVFWALREVP